MKQTVVMMRQPPLARVQTGEALRMALGLTLSDHRVALLYLEEGAFHGLDLKPEVIGQPGIQQSIELFEGMKIRQCVEQEALPPWALPLIRKGVEPISRQGILDLIQQADVIISF